MLKEMDWKLALHGNHRRVCDRCIRYNDLRRCVSCDPWLEEEETTP